ncbi:hypothetical protein [Nodularia spumigena]|nr:hypothetical protein [Nodularia spumigena]
MPAVSAASRSEGIAWSSHSDRLCYAMFSLKNIGKCNPAGDS